MLRRQDGAVAIIVAVLLTAFLAAGAYAIDLGSGRQAEAKAQSSADAAALAAADTLSGCSDTAANCAASATTAAQNMAASNGYPTNSNCSSPNTVGLCVTAPYNGSAYMAKVTEVVNAGATLGGRSGGSSPYEGASSIAAGTQTTSTTVTPVTQTVSTSTTSVTTGTTTNVTTTPAPVIFTGSTGSSAVQLNNMNGGTIGSIVTNGCISENSGNNGGTVSTVSYNSSCGAPNQAHPTIGTTTKNSGALAYPVDPRTSQTIQCPNTNLGSAGTMTETKSGNSDSYSFSVSTLTPQNGPNLSGVYCANTIDLSNSQNFTDTSGAPVTFIANTFSSGGINATLPSTVKSGAVDGIVLWETGSGQVNLNNGSWLATSASSNLVMFTPSATVYLNNNGWPGFNSSFSLEANAFTEATSPGYSYSSPSGVGSTTTNTTTTTGTTTISTSTTSVSSSTSTSTGSGPSALSG